MKPKSFLRSLFSSHPCTSIIVGLTLVSAMVGVVGSRNETPDATPETPAGQKAIIAPRVPLRMIFRPLFKTPDHAFEAGAAFLARVPFSSEPILFTALQNIGPAGGYYTQALGPTLDDTVSGIELREAYSGEKMLSPDIEALPLPATAPLGTLSDAGDVAAFRTRGSLHLDSGLLSEDPSPPAPGRHIWLAFGAPPVSAGEDKNDPTSASPRVHHGVVTASRDGLLYYTFDDPAVPLRGSSGAPVLAEGGRIVGIHLGSTAEGGQIHGIANPVSRFLPALRAACQPVARNSPAQAKGQN